MSKRARPATEEQLTRVSEITEIVGEHELKMALKQFGLSDVSDLTTRQAGRVIKRLTTSVKLPNISKAKPKRKKSTKAGKVYFISDGAGNIKIGYSVNPRKRLASLQTSNPNNLRIMATRTGNKSLEKSLHEKFAAHRVRGEWYREHPDILAEIEATKPKKITGSITDKQYRYLMHLIDKVGQLDYDVIKRKHNLLGIKETDLSKKQATSLITDLVKMESHKVERPKRRRSKNAAKSRFVIESETGTQMQAASVERLLQWAEKRFRGHPDQLRKLKDFLSDSSGKFVTIAGYIIRRAV